MSNETLTQIAIDHLSPGDGFIQRPNPIEVASLINEGLQMEHILSAGRAAGIKMPIMGDLVGELQYLMPYYAAIGDKIASEHGDSTVLFASRDADLLYDYYAIAHPQRESHLLPASVDLWYSRTINRLELADVFFADYGLGAERLRDSRRHFALIDSGFLGSIANMLNRTLLRNYDIDLQAASRLSVRLVDSDSPKFAPAIGEDVDVGDFNGLDFYDNNYIFGSTQSAQEGRYFLAAFLQLLPRYFGSYRGLAERNGDVVATTATDGENEHTSEVRKFYCVNSSIVNPVAAFVVQREVVDAAMKKSGNFMLPNDRLPGDDQDERLRYMVDRFLLGPARISCL